MRVQQDGKRAINAIRARAFGGPGHRLRKGAKGVLRNIVRRFGYEVVPRGALEDRAFALHLESLFALLDIRCVLDVGANRGQYARFLRDRVGFRGTIVSFEPLSKNVALLREQAKADPRWVVRGCALGSQDARMNINVMKHDLLSSFLTPDHSSVRMFNELNVVDHIENVTVRRLDSVMNDLRDDPAVRNVYLKLDTQGFDLEVVRGAPSTLRSVRAMQTELSVMPIYKGSPTYRETLDALTEQNFGITAMFPVTRDELMRVIEFDCVMINGAPDTEVAPRPSRRNRP
jgi:FkbM family methyltransferase